VTAVLTRSQRRILARQIVAAMVRRGDPLTETAAWPGVLAAIKRDPVAFIQVLGDGAGKRSDTPLRASRTIGP
jgi:hypothetical protein